MNICVPNLSDGVAKATVVSVLVSPGDRVKKEDSLIELETEKAVAPVPSPYEGEVVEVLVKEGDVVSVGQVFLKLSSVADSVPPASVRVVSDEGSPSVDVSPGFSSSPPPAPFSSSGFVYESHTGAPPPTSPSIRRLAREVGLDLYRVRGTARGGRITLNDVRDYVQRLQSAVFHSVPNSSPPPSSSSPSPSFDFSKWGPVEEVKVSSLRQKIAERMSDSVQSVPHVTQFGEADLTNLLSVQKRVSALSVKKGVKVSVSALLLFVLAKNLGLFPAFNASLSEDGRSLFLKKYVNIGVAVDSPSGLIVPVLKGVDALSVVEIASHLKGLVDKTMNRSVALEDLQGGSFTLSNLGAIGGGYFTPIVNKPEVAILGVGKSCFKAVVQNDNKSVVSRMVLPLALSYDHRVVDGADGARFMMSLVSLIENVNFDDLGI